MKLVVKKVPQLFGEFAKWGAETLVWRQEPLGRLVPRLLGKDTLDNMDMGEPARKALH